jgi:hypothetical protein
MFFLTRIGLSNLFLLTTITRILNEKLILKLKLGIFKLLTMYSDPGAILHHICQIDQGETIPLKGNKHYKGVVKQIQK